MPSKYLQVPNKWFLYFGIPFLLYGSALIGAILIGVMNKDEFSLYIALEDFAFGIVCSTFGLSCVISYFRRRRKHISTTRDVICIQCQAVYNPDGLERHVCPKCGGELEPIEGLYERHLELNDTE